LNTYGDIQNSQANKRIPYKSAVQLEAETEWISDTPAVRGEKQWQRYNNNKPKHLDWTAKTNGYEVRAPYTGAASLAEYSGDTPAVRGEKQWAVYNNDKTDKHIDWSTNVESRRPYNGGASLSQADPPAAAKAPKYEVKGEK
jgi:hypothetical protein